MVEGFFDSYWSHPGIRKLDCAVRLASSATLKAYSLVGSGGGRRILEVGPGEGRDLSYLRGSGAEVFAADISGASIRLSRISSPETSFCRTDGENLGFRDSVFDVVFSRTVLMHVDRRVFFKECRRVLRPGGKAVFVEPLRYNPLLLFYRAIFSAGRAIEPDYLRPDDLGIIRNYFSSFKAWFYYLFSAVRGPLVSVAPWSARFFLPLELVDRKLLASFPMLQRFSWICVIECTR